MLIYGLFYLVSQSLSDSESIVDVVAVHGAVLLMKILKSSKQNLHETFARVALLINNPRFESCSMLLATTFIVPP